MDSIIRQPRQFLGKVKLNNQFYLTNILVDKLLVYRNHNLPYLAQYGFSHLHKADQNLNQIDFKSCNSLESYKD